MWWYQHGPRAGGGTPSPDSGPFSAGPAIWRRLPLPVANVLRAPTAFSWPRSLLRQFTNFFTVLLNVSGGICLVAHALRPGEGMNVLGLALFGVAALNAIFSFVQEYRAEKAMEETLAEDLLGQFEVEMGLKTPETANIEQADKTLGPSEAVETT